MNILNFFRKPYLGVFLALSILFASCSSGYEDFELNSNSENDNIKNILKKIRRLLKIST